MLHLQIKITKTLKLISYLNNVSMISRANDRIYAYIHVEQHKSLEK